MSDFKNPLAAFKGPTFKGKTRECEGREGERKKVRGKGRGGGGKEGGALEKCEVKTRPARRLSAPFPSFLFRRGEMMCMHYAACRSNRTSQVSRQIAAWLH